MFDSSFDVDFNCNWNSLDEKLFRGSWFYVGSDWVGFGLLKIRISVFCPFSRSAVSFCCQSDLPGDLSILGKSLPQSLVTMLQSGDLPSDLGTSPQ